MAFTSPELEPGRSETFPYEERYAHGVSPLGPVCYFDAGAECGLPPVLLIHALGTNFTHFEYVAPLLVRHTRVIGLDLPGCGHSAKPRHRYRLGDMTEATFGLLDHLRLREVVILGHSFGGMVATTMALSRPDRVLGLCLMNSSGFTRYPAWMRHLARGIVRPALLAPLIRGVVPHLLGNIFGERSERTERFLRQVLERRDPRYAWEFARYATPMLGDIMSDVLDRLDQLTLPVLVIWGDRDALLPLGPVLSWSARLPRGRLVTLAGCGHMPNLERPDKVSEAVLDFLRALGEKDMPRAAAKWAG